MSKQTRHLMSNPIMTYANPYYPKNNNNNNNNNVKSYLWDAFISQFVNYFSYYLLVSSESPIYFI